MRSLRFIGATIRLARHQQGFSTQDIAAITRIPERHVRALEAGDFGSLPGKTFVFGFTRTIGRLLQLDTDRLVADLRAHLCESEAANTERVQSAQGIAMTPRQRGR